MSTARLQKDLVGKQLIESQQKNSSDPAAELEGNILKLLSEASGDILEDEVLIQTLSQVQAPLKLNLQPQHNSRSPLIQPPFCFPPPPPPPPLLHSLKLRAKT
jgi:hypothetical protein